MTKTVIFILIQIFLLIYSCYNEVKQRFHSKTLPTWATFSFHVQVKQEHRSSRTSYDLIKIGICNPTKQICRDVHLFIPQILTVCQFPVRTMDKVPSDWPGAALCFRWQGFGTPHPAFLPLCLQGLLERPHQPGVSYCSISPSQREELMAEPKSSSIVMHLNMILYEGLMVLRTRLPLPAWQVAEDDSHNK